MVEGTLAHLGGPTGFVNPWTWLLAMEGLVAVASLTRPGTPTVCPVVRESLTPVGVSVPAHCTHKLWLPLWSYPSSWTALENAITGPDYLAPYGTTGNSPAHGVSAALGARTRMPVGLDEVVVYPCEQMSRGSTFYQRGQRVGPPSPVPVRTPGDHVLVYPSARRRSLGATHITAIRN